MAKMQRVDRCTFRQCRYRTGFLCCHSAHGSRGREIPIFDESAFPEFCPLPDAPEETATPKPLEAWTKPERRIVADALDAREPEDKEKKKP